jgi:site-specific DNA-cytosine methylase
MTAASFLRPRQHRVFHAHLFSGAGFGAKGFDLAHAQVGRLTGKPVCLGGIDVDARACAFASQTLGVPFTPLDLFSKDQYTLWHGSAPPADWSEASPADVREAFQHRTPDIIFLSAPCQGVWSR